MKLKMLCLLTSAFLALATAAPAQPIISQVTIGSIPNGIFQGPQIEIVIQGSGFGTASASTGTFPFLRIFDVTQGWEAGFPSDKVNVGITSWAGTKIDLTGFSGVAYNTLYTFNSGDLFEIQVQNPQTPNGWATYYASLSPTFLVLDIQPPQTGFPLVISDSEINSLLNALTAQLQQAGLVQPGSGAAITAVVSTQTGLFANPANDVDFINFWLALPSALEGAAEDIDEFGLWGAVPTVVEQAGDHVYGITPDQIVVGEAMSIQYEVNYLSESNYLNYNCYTFPMNTSEPDSRQTVDFVIGGEYELRIIIPLSQVPQGSIDLQCLLGNWQWGIGDVQWGDIGPIDSIKCGSGLGLKVWEYSFNYEMANNPSPSGYPTFNGFIKNALGNELNFTVSVPTTTSTPCAAYTISASSSPPAGGTATVSGGGIAYAGLNVTVSATPNLDYVFANWTDSNGNVVSSSPSYTFTATGSQTLTANFAQGSDAMCFSTLATGFNWPAGIAVDNSKNVYVANNGCSGDCPPGNGIMKITPQGVVSMIAGGSSGFADGPGSSAQFGGPSGIALDNMGNIYVADAGNNAVRKMTVDSTGTWWVTTIATGIGYYAYPVWSSDPHGIAVDNASNVYLGEVNNQVVQRISSAGIVSTVAGQPGFWNGGYADGTNGAALFKGPWGVSLDTNGNVYVAEWENDDIRKIAPDKTGTNWVVSTIAGSPRPFGYSGFADGTNGAAVLWEPQGIAVGVDGNLYVADTDNNAIRKIVCDSTGTNWIVTTLSQGFHQPSGVAVGTNGDIYVADTGANAILKGVHYAVPPASWTVTTVSSPPDEGSTGGGGSYTNGQIVTVGATPNSCYSFKNWTVNGNTVSTSSSYTFTNNGGLNLVANFVPTVFSVSTTSFPSAGGTTSGGGTVNCGTPVTITAVASNGYTFLNWTEDNNNVSVSQSFTFTPSTNVTLVAHFVMQSSNWQTGNAGTNQSLNGIAYGNNEFVAVGETVSNYVQSVVTNVNYILVFTNGEYYWITNGFYVETNVVTVDEGGAIVTSPDSINWTICTSGTSNILYGITYGKNEFVAVGEKGAILSSPDGINWTNSNSETTNALYGVAFGNNTFVAVGQGDTFLISTDGVEWVGGNLASAIVAGGNFAGIAFGNNTFVAAGNEFWGPILYSFDGFNWYGNRDVNIGFNSTVYGNGRYVAVGGGGLFYTFTTPDGGGILTESRIGYNNLLGVTYGNNTFVIVNNAGAIFLSPDGINWTNGPLIASTSLNAVAYGNNEFVAVGENGTIIVELFANTEPSINWGIATIASPASGGATTGGGTVNPEDTVTITAIPNSGWQFLNWANSGTVVTTSSNFTFTATGNQAFTANFIPNIPLLGFGSQLWNTRGFNLMLQGPIGSNYEIDASTDLFNWVPVTTFTSTDSPFFFSDLSVTNFNQRFYRAVMQ